MTAPADGLRLPGVGRGRRVKIVVNGRPAEAYDGESVAAVLITEGERAFRRTPRRGEPRGLFCGMGVCYDCLVVIDGQPGCRACMTLVRDGMVVRLQDGWD